MGALDGRGGAGDSRGGPGAPPSPKPWVWRKDVVEPPDAPGGAVVAVLDPRGQPAGQALWAGRSPLALRLLTRRPPTEERVDDAWFRTRLEASIARRAATAREAQRLVHAEADGLPGLFVDRYRDRLVLQTLSEGMDARKEMLAAELVALTSALQVIARDDGSGRDFEQLPREARVLRGPASAEVDWREGENVFHTDLLTDMKTGAFLDQAENHLRAAELGRGRALDAFSYHGGFALALAPRLHLGAGGGAGSTRSGTAAGERPPQRPLAGGGAGGQRFRRAPRARPRRGALRHGGTRPVRASPSAGKGSAPRSGPTGSSTSGRCGCSGPAGCW